MRKAAVPYTYRALHALCPILQCTHFTGSDSGGIEVNGFEAMEESMEDRVSRQNIFCRVSIHLSVKMLIGIGSSYK